MPVDHGSSSKPDVDAPREVHRSYALYHGYFWLPCPRCGKWWGGHEEDKGRIVLERDSKGYPVNSMMTCCSNPSEETATEKTILMTRRARGENV